MEVASENTLLNVVDQIYESIERPGLWPETIYAIGGLIGGRRHFWGLDQGIEASDIDLARQADPFEIGCYDTIFFPVRTYKLSISTRRNSAS